MSLTYKQNPKSDISWYMLERLSGYSAVWYLYQEKFLEGIMVRCQHSVGWDEELLPTWITVA